ncbi:hypothetical protein Acor_04700 [Acrocarpospora corrugata]|uniref:Uncharacterized protein n=1 Tax=Acrocarpospora corrugata TaxID=35763 RepID=A0A5M3VQB7_9ACTN|nr:hypothetical protein [Acrocarpospora corrugata]GER98408.1 hypothetical protein Acor_04700 [Acrocarpospora corrugata]
MLELGAAGLVVYQLSRDEAGIPRCWVEPVRPWPGPGGEYGWAADPEPARNAILDMLAATGGGPALLVVTHAGGATDQALAWLREARPDAAAGTAPGADLTALLRRAMAEDPLTLSYDLVVLTRAPGSGRLEFAGHPLFPIGSRRGDTVGVPFHCEFSDPAGVAFAVVAWEGKTPDLLSLHAAALPPGAHELTAELRAPGRVRLTGLSGLAPDRRDWSDLIASVPGHWRPHASPSHLICAIETCGEAYTVGDRLDRAEQMVKEAAGRLPGRLRVSLLTYGAHAYEFKAKQEPVRVLEWAADPARSLDALTRLRLDLTVRPGYPDGAQVEDMLAEVLDGLGREHGGDHTALLIVGGRPPHPPYARSHILPCPDEHDWEELALRFESRPGATLGVICDRPADQAGPEWFRLGRAALADLSSVDIPAFGTALGLAARDQRINFPLM